MVGVEELVFTIVFMVGAALIGAVVGASLFRLLRRLRLSRAVPCVVSVILSLVAYGAAVNMYLSGSHSDAVVFVWAAMIVLGGPVAAIVGGVFGSGAWQSKGSPQRIG